MIKQITAAFVLAATSFAASAAEPYYIGADVGSTKIEDSNSETSFGVFAGYKFTPNIAVEAGYRRLGEWKVLGADVDVSQIAVSVLAIAPIDDKFSVYGRLGRNRVEAKVLGHKDHENDTVYGVGVSYQLTKEVSARLEWQRPINDSRNISVGVAYQF